MRLEYVDSGIKEYIKAALYGYDVAPDMIEKAFRDSVAVPDKHPKYVYRVYKHGKRNSYMLYRKKLF